ncbi:MAG: hypothetical protein JJ869_22395 [Marivita sp.]|uniref:hypothetical protein n=1 Tax=Marivita sp. TaxID=2003365 RepID=UPI001B1A5E12|nr:hypothetical protein [Marivita sp.]MBO6886302.1 hypothetical protein [Marivita sp.]
MQVTIRFADPRTAHESVDRALGCILLQTEAKTANRLIGGFYFDTERAPQNIFDAFAADGFEKEDFTSITFAWS